MEPASSDADRVPGGGQTAAQHTHDTLGSQRDVAGQGAAAPQPRSADPLQQRVPGNALGPSRWGQGGLAPLPEPLASPLLHGSGVLPVTAPNPGAAGGLQGGVPRPSVNPLQLQQQLMAAAAMAAAAQAAQDAAGRPPQEPLHQLPQLSGAGAGPQQEHGACCKAWHARERPPRPPQREPQAGQQAALPSALMEDPRFAQVLMQLQQQARSSVASGSTSRLRPSGGLPADAGPDRLGKSS